MPIHTILAAAGLLLAGCSHLPSWSVGPPYGDDLQTEHHPAEPASSERAAEPTVVEDFSSHGACVRRLALLTGGEIVRISAIEARGWRQDPAMVQEFACAGSTLLRRAWAAPGEH